MTDIKNSTVGDIVVQNIKAAHVFKKHGIDFCCGGGISVGKACEKYNVDYKTLEDELTQIDQAAPLYNYNSWNLTFLVDHIINVHHTYVQENMPLMYQYAEKVSRVHGERHPELKEIFRLVVEIIQDLEMHMKKEENILFPYVKLMEMEKMNGNNVPQSQFGTVNNPISMMENEHERAGDIFKRISELTNNYTPPEGACNTFRALYAKLEEFEQDLHQHVHLENNILFKKAIELEKELQG